MALLRERGLRGSPKLAVGDGALGLWKALSAVYPECRQQRCWVHKTLNVLNALPKRMQPKVKAALHADAFGPKALEAHQWIWETGTGR